MLTAASDLLARASTSAYGLVVTAPRQLPRDIGAFIRDLRKNARISLRQLAEQAGVSNPYLSQIERGLRKPSAEVLAQLAGALRVSTPLMYLRAGLLDGRDGQGVLAAIAADPDLTVAQKQSLTQIYETFRRENTRLAAEADESAGSESVPDATAVGGPDTGAEAGPGATTAVSGTARSAAKRSTAKRRTATGSDGDAGSAVTKPARRRAAPAGGRPKNDESPDTPSDPVPAVKTLSAAPRRPTRSATAPRRTRATSTTIEEK